MLVLLKNEALQYFSIKTVTGVLQRVTLFCGMILETLGLCGGHRGTCSAGLLLELVTHLG